MLNKKNLGFTCLLQQFKDGDKERAISNPILLEITADHDPTDRSNDTCPHCKNGPHWIGKKVNTQLSSFENPKEVFMKSEWTRI